LEDLHRWRKFILENACFVDAKGNPGSLLTSYKCNIRLVEVCHLILGNFKNGSDLYKDAIAANIEQLENERKIWLHYPELLSQDELINPLTILENFFVSFSLPEYRVHLGDWLDTGLSFKSGNEFMDAADVIAIYDNLQKLYGAAWLLYQRLSLFKRHGN
jgi:hypothetical protein